MKEAMKATSQVLVAAATMEEADKCHIVMYPSPGRGHLMSCTWWSSANPSSDTTLASPSPSSSPPLPSPPPPSPLPPLPSPSATSLPSPSPPLSPPAPPPSLTTRPRTLSTLASTTPSSTKPCLKLFSASKPSQKAKALVVDFFYGSAAEVAAALHLPAYYYFPSGANPLAAFLYLPTLHKLTNTSFKDLDDNVDVPGLPLIPAKDMPSRMLDRREKCIKFFSTVSL